MILSFDIGTTTVKGSLYNSATGSFILTRYPLPADKDRSFAPVRWQEAIRIIVQKLEITNKTGVRAILVSGHGPTVIPVSKSGEPLNSIMDWTGPEFKRYSGEIESITGSEIDTAFFLSRIYALSRRDPSVFEKTAFFLGCPEYVTFYLTGNSWTFLPNEKFERYYWNDAVLSKLGMDGALFPPFIRTGELAGKVSREAETRTGLPAGVPVLATGPDYFMALIGTNTYEPGQLCDRTGTSEGFNLCSRRSIHHKMIRISPHPRQNFLNNALLLPFSGRMLNRLKSAVSEPRMDYKRLFSEIKGISPESLDILFLFYPSFHSGGVFYGLHRMYKRSHLFRAVCESMAFWARKAITIFESNGCPVSEMRVCGRLAESRFLNQLKADITGKKIWVPGNKEAEITGNTAAGLCYLGEYSHFEEAAGHIVTEEEILLPEKHSLFEERFALFDALSDRF
ncbi:MAG: FGGY-family carbohydrate kinase [Spirochaetales bacterium]|nr:FGGY-family carbohydrate kinase [Spirochaetales bacterium]